MPSAPQQQDDSHVQIARGAGVLALGWPIALPTHADVGTRRLLHQKEAKERQILEGGPVPNPTDTFELWIQAFERMPNLIGAGDDLAEQQPSSW